MHPIYVIFGTETYNAQDLADRTGEAIEALGLAVDVLDMDDVDLDTLAAAHTVLIITSTFGDGEPPSNAEALYDDLMSAAPSLAHVRYAVCGLGDSSYPKFNQCARDFDARFAELGAQCLLPRVECDVDFEGPWGGWLDALLALLPGLDQGAVPAAGHDAPAYAEPAYAEPAYAEPAYAEPAYAEPAYAEPAYAEPAYAEPAYAEPARAADPYPAQQSYAEPAAPAPAARRHGMKQSPYRYPGIDDVPDYGDMATHAFIRASAPAVPPPKKAPKRAHPIGSRKNPFVATVLENYNLNGPGSEKETRHVALSLKGADVRYSVGDSLGLFPNNCPDLVRRIVQGCVLRGDEEVDVAGEVLPLRTALTYRLDCVGVDRKLLRLAVANGHPRATAPLQRLLDDPEACRAWCAEHHIIDVIDEAFMRPEPQALVDVLKPLGPRLYSISSSQLAHPGEVHLTIDVVRYELHGRTRKGISSSFIGERCGPGVKVPIFVRPAEFGLVDDDYAPIIMVGPGTGIAPFRAFLEEREARGAEGYSWLFFGARYAACDYLYQSTIEGWIEAGVLTRLDLAFSRDQSQKIYVQDRMREHGADLFAWLEAGSYFYVCGDASRMARDVNEALLEVVGTYGGYDRPGAEAYLQRMTAEGRYQRDVY